MYLAKENLILDMNSAGEYYIINIKTGAKCTWTPPYGGICPDLITQGDVKRALADEIDISNLSREPLSKEEYIEFVGWAYSFRKKIDKN